jgi:integrase
VEFASLALAASEGKSASMATLENRSGKYRVIFYFDGQRFSRSLKTKREQAAIASIARLEDNLRRVELGLLAPPEGSDLASFLLSDGRIEKKPELPVVRSMHVLFENYFASIPAGSIEENTKKGMQTHIKHLERILGKHLDIHSLEASVLQHYIEQRADGKGLHGRKVSAATIKKEIVTLRTVWNWSFNMGLLKRTFPNRGLRYPKLEERPPFQTVAEIERRIKRGGLTKAQEADLWDAAFLTLPEIDELLVHVKKHALQPFIYPMFAFAAHTGARRSEMIRSEVSDIDFTSGTVQLHEKKRVRGKLSTRRVPLSPLLATILRAWLNNHPGGEHTFCLSLDVLRSRKGRDSFMPLTDDETHDHFKRTLKNSKWSKLRGWHVFRHSFCSNCASKGLDQRLINGWVGHQSEDMVKRYRHLIPDQQRDAIRLVFQAS